ncbi:unnamed protein product [Prunus armeniaca]|uniref:Uncharacterized protein n=1 Tax=Prunus armeniaca TaxID=36596 RepID=A0A6J5UVD1_PRUAR|nr:unnamed protein product [Prunus armeniaca]CAB4311033.1 unnamed protein product [Prunus armeniaca]
MSQRSVPRAQRGSNPLLTGTVRADALLSQAKKCDFNFRVGCLSRGHKRLTAFPSQKRLKTLSHKFRFHHSTGLNKGAQGWHDEASGIKATGFKVQF